MEDSFYHDSYFDSEEEFIREGRPEGESSEKVGLEKLQEDKWRGIERKIGVEKSDFLDEYFIDLLKDFDAAGEEEKPVEREWVGRVVEISRLMEEYGDVRLMEKNLVIGVLERLSKMDVDEMQYWDLGDYLEAVDHMCDYVSGRPFDKRRADTVVNMARRKHEEAMWVRDFGKMETKRHLDSDKVVMAAASGMFGLVDRLAAIAEAVPPVRRAAYKAGLEVLAGRVNHILGRDLVENKVDGVYLEKNKDRRSYMEIVREGVEKFRKVHPDVALKYERGDEYLGVSKWSKLFNRVIDLSLLDNIERWSFKSKVANFKGRKLGVAMLETMRLGVVNAKTWQDEFTDLLPRAVKEPIDDVENTAYTHRTGDGRHGEMVQNIFERVSQRTEVVSASECIFMALELTGGDLIESMRLVGSLFKMQSRNVDTNGWQWMREHIRDEYSEYASFNTMPAAEQKYPGKLRQMWVKYMGKITGDTEGNMSKIYFDLSFPNRLGLPYHAADMVGLLGRFAPEVIVFLVSGEYVRYGAQHGLLKLLADVRVVRELHDIDRYFGKVATGIGEKTVG